MLMMTCAQVPAPGLPLWLVPNNTQLVQGDEEAAGPVARGGRLSPQPSAQVVATPGVMSASGEQLRMIAGLITPRASSSQVPELQSLPAAGPAPQAGARGRSRGSLALLGAISEQQEQPAGAGGQRQQRRSRLSFDLGRPAGAGPGTGRAAAGPASAAAAAGGGGGMWENDAQLEARITRHRRTGSLGQPAEQAPHAACFTPVDPGELPQLCAGDASEVICMLHRELNISRWQHRRRGARQDSELPTMLHALQPTRRSSAGSC